MKAVFLDRDNTLIKDIPYTHDPKQVEVFPEAIEALKIFHRKGYIFFVVTNQRGVEDGIYTLPQVYAVHEKISQILVQHQLEIKEFQICPHGKNSLCECRKPKAGLIFNVLKKYQINLELSFMIGDKDIDYEAGINAGIKNCFKIGHPQELIAIAEHAP